MIQDEKELLLKDLCARLPYCVKIEEVSGGILEVTPRTDVTYVVENGGKPYLRPMDSMTDEDLISYAIYDFANDTTYKIVNFQCTGEGVINIYCALKHDTEYRLIIFQMTRTSPLKNWQGIDWLNAHHFDYRGLIEKGLALEAPEGMYEK